MASFIEFIRLCHLIADITDIADILFEPSSDFFLSSCRLCPCVRGWLWNGGKEERRTNREEGGSDENDNQGQTWNVEEQVHEQPQQSGPGDGRGGCITLVWIEI